MVSAREMPQTQSLQGDKRCLRAGEKSGKQQADKKQHQVYHISIAHNLNPLSLSKPKPLGYANSP
jgi:hypothetical protein